MRGDRPSNVAHMSLEGKYSPWLRLNHTQTSSTLVEFPQAYTSLGFSAKATPVHTLLIGSKSKSELLRHLTGKSQAHLNHGHGQILLWPDPGTLHSSSPSIFIDYELQTFHRSQWSTTSASESSCVRTIEWASATPGINSRRRIANLLGGRVLGALCDTICYFAGDLGGLQAVAVLIAEQAALPPRCDLPRGVLPTVTVVIETKPDECGADSALMETIHKTMRNHYGLNESEIQLFFERHFARLKVVTLRKRMSLRNRASAVQEALQDTREQFIPARAAHGTAFRTAHIQAFVSRSLDSFCANYEASFSFAARSRPDGFNDDDLLIHLQELFTIVPSDEWLFHLVCPLVSSAIVFTNYPPGSHSTSPLPRTRPHKPPPPPKRLVH